MSRVPLKPPHPLHLRASESEQQRVSAAEAEDAVARPEVKPNATLQPNDAPSEDDLIEAGFDNMPV
jgi:hypothetical protein